MSDNFNSLPIPKTALTKARWDGIGDVRTSAANGAVPRAGADGRLPVEWMASDAVREIDTVAELLADTTFSYTAGENKVVVAAGDRLVTREGPVSHRVLASDAVAHSTNADGYWEAPAAPVTIRVRGEQIPAGGFDLRQFGAKIDGTNDSAAINYALLIASQTARYTTDPDGFRTYLSAPILVPAGQIGFTETIVLQPNAQLWGSGMGNTMFRRVAGTSHAFATKDFAALEAEPSGATLIPGSIGLRDLTIVDGVLADFDAAAGTGYGLAMHAYNVMLNNLQVYAPKREKGIYQGQTVRAQILDNTSLLALSQSPFLIEEDFCDIVIAKRANGDGFTWGSNDAHLGRIWAVTNKGAGAVMKANSLHVQYIHAYSNHDWNIIFDGPMQKVAALEARDGRKGGVWFKFDNISVGDMRVGNNLRGLGVDTIAVEEQCDVRISNREINIKEGTVTVSAGKVGVRYDTSHESTDVNLQVRAPESGDFTGQGVAVQFATAAAQNRLRLGTRNFNHADSAGVDVLSGSAQSNFDLDLNVFTSGPVNFRAFRTEGAMTRSRFAIRCNSSHITAVKSGAGAILSTAEINLRDLASDIQQSRFHGNSANFAVDATGVRTLTISVPGGWFGGVVPDVGAGQVQAHVQPNGTYNDFAITPVRVTIAATEITVSLAVLTASATVGATARVNVLAFVGAI